ncbi:uncharacterized protein V6R79_008881 [Siganus canaliculatus]
MAQRMFHESWQDGRSVLGSVAVQVERDPKTGATVVRSVAPVPMAEGAPMATTVFDDGRKSIHAVGGGVADQPSSEELEQILNVIDGVGMKVLLEEVTVTPNKAETKIVTEDDNTSPEGYVLSSSTCHVLSEDGGTELERTGSNDLETELETEDSAASVDAEDEKEEDRSVVAVRDIAGEVATVEEQRLDEGPVTLVFLGYTDSTADQDDDGQEDGEGMLTAERVMITEDGEEHVIGDETPASPEIEKEVFQDVALEGNGSAGVKIQEEEGAKELPSSSLPSIPDIGDGRSKACKCCSVM